MSYEECDAADAAWLAGQAEADNAVRVQQEKVAALRGYAGKLRAQIVQARDVLLHYEHRAVKPDYPLDALMILSRALEIEAP